MLLQASEYLFPSFVPWEFYLEDPVNKSTFAIVNMRVSLRFLLTTTFCTFPHLKSHQFWLHLIKRFTIRPADEIYMCVSCRYFLTKIFSVSPKNNKIDWVIVPHKMKHFFVSSPAKTFLERINFVFVDILVTKKQ